MNNELRKKKKKWIILLVVFILVIVVAVSLFFIFKKKNSFSPHSTSESNHQDNSNKKSLARKIKEDIKGDLEKVKKYVIEPTCNVFQGVIYTKNSSYNESKLEKKDYDEILNLIKQVNDLNNEKIEWRRKEIEKTDNKEKVFYYLANVNGLWLNTEEGKRYLLFQKIHNKNIYQLKIVTNHPSLTNYSFTKGIGDDKTHRFYLIDINPDSFEKAKVSKDNFFRKEINLTDKITITPTNP